MRHSKLSMHWSIRRQQLILLTSTCLEMVARDSSHFCWSFDMSTPTGSQIHRCEQSNYGSLKTCQDFSLDSFLVCLQHGFEGSARNSYGRITFDQHQFFDGWCCHTQIKIKSDIDSILSQYRYVTRFCIESVMLRQLLHTESIPCWSKNTWVITEPLQTRYCTDNELILFGYVCNTECIRGL
jgi:hypothetical protein